MATLPRHDVAVSTGTDYSSCKERLDVVISRDGKAKSFSSEKSSATERVKEVVEKLIGDGATAEYLP